jgi:hypothetical protein
MDVDADRADLELRLIKLLLKNRPCRQQRADGEQANLRCCDDLS